MPKQRRLRLRFIARYSSLPLSLLLLAVGRLGAFTDVDTARRVRRTRAAKNRREHQNTRVRGYLFIYFVMVACQCFCGCLTEAVLARKVSLLGRPRHGMWLGSTRLPRTHSNRQLEESMMPVFKHIEDRNATISSALYVKGLCGGVGG